MDCDWKSHNFPRLRYLAAYNQYVFAFEEQRNALELRPNCKYTQMFSFIDHALMEIIFLPNKTAFNDRRDKSTI